MTLNYQYLGAAIPRFPITGDDSPDGQDQSLFITGFARSAGVDVMLMGGLFMRAE